MSCLEHKSPSHKLIKFFEKSRNNWEEKAKNRRKENKDLKARIRDLEVSRKLWRGKGEGVAEQLQIKNKELLETHKTLARIQANQDLLKIEYDDLKKSL